MNRSDTARLLAKAQIVDNRTVDAATVQAWHEAIGHLEYDDAIAALDQHRRSSTAWVEPAHINALAKLARQNRESLAAKARALGALPPAPVQGPPPWFRREAGIRDPEDHPPIPCPWCGAKAHSPCTVRGSDRPLLAAHPSRTEAASTEAASFVPEEEQPW